MNGLSDFEMIVLILAAVFGIFGFFRPEILLELQKRVNSLIGVEYEYSGRTVIVVRLAMIFMVLLILFLVFFYSAEAVRAHIPLDTEGPATRAQPIMIEDHKISWAAYNRLEQPGDVNYYRFEAGAGEEIYVSMMVPHLERLKDYSPDYALIGPGLEDDMAGLDEAEIRSRLDIEEGEGARVKRYTGPLGEEADTFFEHFTRTEYWRRQESTITAPETGTYFVAVFSGAEQTGKYVLAVGREERWGIGDIVRMPKIWWDVRMFMEEENSTYIFTGILAAAGAYLVFRLLR